MIISQIYIDLLRYNEEIPPPMRHSNQYFYWDVFDENMRNFIRANMYGWSFGKNGKYMGEGIDLHEINFKKLVELLEMTCDT